jgi:hypothetical protein
MSTLKIGIASYDEMKALTLAIARGQRKLAPHEPRVWFPSTESFAKVLSAGNRDLLRIIAEKAPGSLDELAELAGSYLPVPPTVILSSLIVGIPTPTGTLCPSLPQVPMPSSSFRSCPTIDTYFSASGPLPISVASLHRRGNPPSSIRYASEAEKTNLPLVISTCPPPKFTA